MKKYENISLDSPSFLSWAMKVSRNVHRSLVKSNIVHTLYIFIKRFLKLVCLFVLFWLNVPFNNLSVISGRCLDEAGSSLLLFRVLSNRTIISQTLDIIFQQVKLYWADQFWFQSLLNAKLQEKEQVIPFLISLVWLSQGSNQQPPGQTWALYTLSHCAGPLKDGFGYKMV